MYMLYALGVLIMVALLFAASRPTHFAYTRSATMAAGPEAVFAEVNDFHRWGAWSPWARLDPHMVSTYNGPKTGPGATFGWSSERMLVGSGYMTITELDPAHSITIDHRFRRPFDVKSTAHFTFEPAQEGTLVTWAVKGNYGLLSKIVSVFVNMDKRIGADFERGLAALKRVVEVHPSA
jgi:hypothetical protein